MRRHGRWLLATLGVAVLVAAGALAWHLRRQQQTYYTDAASIHQSADKGPPRDILWAPPARLGEIVNTAGDEHGAALSLDGNELYFVRGRAGGGADIHVMRRGPEGWTAPEPVAALNTPADELRPALAPDGRSLYFASNRPGGTGGYDIWVARRGPRGWQAPENPGAPVNSRYDDYAPATDGRVLYFASNRPEAGDETAPPDDAWAAQIADDARGRDYDLYAAADGAVVALDGVNSSSNETAAAVSPLGDFLYFASDRPGGAGGFDLYRARRIDGTLAEPVSLGEPVNSPANELDAALGDAGFSLHFSSDRGHEGGSDYDLHYTISREVFRYTETWRARFDLAALWAMVWPWLLFTLLAAAVLTVLIDVFRRMKYHRLDLLARCVLVSLIAHMVLMVAFGLWAVRVAPQAWQRPATGMKVALTSPSIGAGTVQQLRGELVSPELASTAQEVARTDYRDATGEQFVASTRVAVQRASLEVAASPASAIEAREARAARPAEAAPRHLEPERPVAPVRVAMPTAGPQQREDETTEPLVVRAAPAARAGHWAETPWPRADEAPVALAPASAESPVTELTMALAETRDAAAPRSASVGGPDLEAMRDIGGAVPLELAALPERSAGEPAVEQGFLGSAEIGASAAAAAAVSVPAAPPPAEVAMRPGAFAVDASATSLSVAETAEASAAPAPPPPGEAADLALVALPSLDLPDLPEYHRTQLGQPDPESPLPLAAASQASVETALEPDQPFAGAPLAPQPATAIPEVASLALLPMAEAASAPAMRGRDIGSVGPDVVHLDLGPMEEAAAALEAEVAMEWEGAEPSAPRGAFPAPPLEASPIAPELALADAPPAAETPMTSALPARDTSPAPAPRGVLPAAALALLPLDLKLPTQTVPNPYPQRDPEKRLELAKEMGGDERTEEAVTLALDWLARHQSADGRWDGTHFDKNCGACSGIQQVKSNIALTGLSLLAFQAAGHTHKSPGPYRDVVADGIDWLLSQQQASGALYGGESLYSHGIAMIALAEAYGMTGDPRLEQPVKIGCEFIYASRHKPSGGWRYTPGQYGDTSVLGWQIMALTSARRAEVDVPDDAFEVARDWLRLVDHPNRPGQYRYQPDRNVTPAMTAEGMFVQQLLGAGRGERRQRGSAQYILQHPPRWDIDPNTYYWYYATLALFQHQGAAWDRWNEQVKDQLVAHQRKDGSAAGSWDPEGRWSQVAGRIYQTAMCTLTLEVYYRYLPSFVDER